MRRTSESKGSGESVGNTGHWADMAPQDAWSHLEKTFRRMLGRELDLLRREQGLSQVQLAERIDTTQSVLSRLFKGEDERSPTLDTLVRVACGLNHYIELNLVSELPSRTDLIPTESDRSLWPGFYPVVLDICAPVQVHFEGSRVRKLEVETGKTPDRGVIPHVEGEIFFRHRMANEELSFHDLRTHDFQIIMSIVTRVEDKRKNGGLLFEMNVDVSGAYYVGEGVSQEMLSGLVEDTIKQAHRQLWGPYRETLKTIASRCGMPLRVIQYLQEALARPPKESKFSHEDLLAAAASHNR